MRIAIVHYHLKRGGVTRVIESALKGMESTGAAVHCVVLSGEAPADEALASRTATVEGLHYSNTRERDPAPEELLQGMRDAARRALGGTPDLWHIHNHSLGKNGALPGVVEQLARDGEALLLQMHDFAEDGRPDNYRLIQSSTGTDKLYPSSPRIHYAVLNGRDRSLLLETGIEPAQVHMLPNPVTAEATDTSGSNAGPVLDYLNADRLVLYPVRAVRRKNFGEMLLWAAMAAEGTVFANTLGPTNRTYTPAYERWKAFAAERNLPVRLGLAEEVDIGFGDLVSAATCLLSTSLAEGFGLGFLEPWLFEKPVTGRNLPEITRDFRDIGLDLDGFYEGLYVPEKWIQTDALRDRIAKQLDASYRTYERAAPTGATESALEAIRNDRGGIDFGGLDESMQEAVIDRLLEDPAAASALHPQSLGLAPDADRVARNRECVRENFSAGNYATRLSGLYRAICSAPGGTPSWLPAGRLLDAFLDPGRFRLLRT